jgi:hypothetical protein
MIEIILALAAGTALTGLLTYLFPADDTEVKEISVENYLKTERS